ncbi:hypothetical protein PAMA_002996 [Pampus argenteus]
MGERSRVKAKGNPESHFDAGTEQRTPRNGEKPKEKEKLGGSLIPNSPGGNTTLTQTGWQIQWSFFFQKHRWTTICSKAVFREMDSAVSTEVFYEVFPPRCYQTSRPSRFTALWLLSVAQ